MNTVIGMVLALGVIILVHEWGHFIIARLFKVRVDVFSIGFGPRLFGKKWGETDWRLSALPLGGYVRMAGQDLSEIDSGEAPPTGAPDELMSKKRWQRALICFAGPAVNLIFPILLLGGYYLIVGEPHPSYYDQAPVVNALPSVSGTATTFEQGDKIVSVDGHPTTTWEQVLKALPTPSAAPAVSKMEVQNNGASRTVDVTIKKDRYDHPLGYLPLAPVVGQIIPGKPAARAGVHTGDLIRTVDGQPVQYWDQFVDLVRSSGGKPLAIQVLRNDKLTDLTVTPKQGASDASEKNYQIGIGPEVKFNYRSVKPGEAIKTAFTQTGDMIGETVGVIGKLFSGSVSVKELQSVVGISRAAGEAVAMGSLAIVTFMALISVNLGILNLLPIPILDGGQIFLLALEGLRRRDFSLRFKERFIQVGLVFLLVLFAYVMYNDVVRQFPIHS